MKAILVDDEKYSIEILRVMIAKFLPNVEIVAACMDPVQAIEQIRVHQPEIVFLDVQMPRLTGFQLLQQTRRTDFEVIFITSSEEHALEALKAGAIDYLLKPVQPEELKQAYVKVVEKKDSTRHLNRLINYLKPQKQVTKRIALTASEHLVFVEPNDIIYCESDSNYTTFFLTTGEKVMIAKTLKDVEDLLPREDFFRIHASYLINTKHVTKFTRGDSGYVIMSNNQQLSVSRNKKDEFFEMFSKL
ncbi:MAG TPA: LytTR family DNA-binding domain-containing protein [Chryseosolibacter sp.]